MVKPLVTGTGILTSGGIGIEAVWDSIVNKQVNKTREKYLLNDHTEIEFEKYAIPKISLNEWVTRSDYDWLKKIGLHEDQDFCYLVVAAKLAIENAGLHISSPNRISLIIGHENPGVVNLVDKLIKQDESLTLSNPESVGPLNYQKYQDYFYNIQTFPYLFYLSKVLGINGSSYIVNNACATGLYAIEMGKNLIQCGTTDTVIIVCSDYAHATEYLWLSKKGFISNTNTIRPFDKNRDGSVLGDGAGAIILESGRRKEHNFSDVLVQYSGGDFAQDTWNMVLPDVTKNLYSQVIRYAAEQFSSGPIDLLVPHGTGSSLWDQYEGKEITKAFHQLNASVPDILALKGYIGHTLGASALVETIILLECLKRNIVPETLHYQKPDSKIPLNLNMVAESKELKRVMKSVSAYGGFLAASVFEKI